MTPPATEITLLKEEIARQQYIIRLLTNRNMALEQALSRVGNPEGDNPGFLSPLVNIAGDFDSLISLAQNVGSDHQQEISPVINPGSDIGVSVPQVIKTVGDISLPVPHPENVMADKEVLEYLWKQLSAKGMSGLPHRFIRNAASALLLLSRTNRLDYHEVSKALGYTKRSATKFLIALRRRGLAERRGTRNLYLTDSARSCFPPEFFA